MAIKKSSSTKQNTPSSSKKVKTSFTNTSGQKVTVYTDGSKTYSGGSSSSKSSTSKPSTPSTPSTPTSTPQSSQLEQMKQTLLKMQSDIQSGNVTGLDPSPTKPVTTPTPVSTPSPYTGPSVVDYLNTTGQASDFASRAVLAKNAGITGYTGTAEQNTQLLNTLRLNTKSAIPSTALTESTTPQDVLDRRAQIQSEIDQKQGKIAELQALIEASKTDVTLGETGSVNPITNPDQYLSQYFTTDYTRTMTPAQIEQKRLLDEAAKTTEDFYANRDKTVENANDEYGVTSKQEALGKVQKEMADREVKLRNDVQALETSPEYRGVSRAFANDQREAIKSKGAFDLANLAIVESAYRGDLDTARTLAQDLIDNQFKTFEGKIESYKARLAALLPQLEGEEKQQALALEAAFDAQARAIADKKADTELRYEYMALAAKAGAPESVYKSILKATSADEAFMIAAPYMRDTKKASTGTTYGTSGGGINEVVSGLSAYNSPLADLDLNNSKTTMTQIKNGVRAQFSPEFSTKLISSLTDEQLRDFLIQYDMAQREAGMNMPPEEVLKAYLEFIGKAPKSGTSSGSDNLDSRIDNAF